MVFSAPIELNVWVGYAEVMPTLQKAIEDYERENPNIKINAMSMDVRELERKVAVAVPTGTSADIVELDHMPAMRYISAGLFDEMPENLGRMATSILPPEYMELVSIDGKIYGMPWFVGQQFLYYNKTMFEEAGLSGPPETIDELMEQAKKLTKYDANGNVERSGIALRIAGAGSGVAHKWVPYLIAYGGEVLTKTEDGKYHNGYDNEAGRKALKYYIDALYKYKVDSFNVKHDSEAFALENTAMFHREAWVIGYMQSHAPGVEYDTAPMPGEIQRATTVITANLHVPKASKNSEAAWDFVEYLMRGEYAKSLMLDAGWLPARRDLDFTDVYDVHPQFRGAMEVPEGYLFVPFSSIPPSDEILTKLASRLTQAFLDPGLLDNPEGIAKVIEDAAKETDQILKDHGLYGEK
jgi:multiple sugar transport system substrate-binding protein